MKILKSANSATNFVWFQGAPIMSTLEYVLIGATLQQSKKTSYMVDFIVFMAPI